MKTNRSKQIKRAWKIARNLAKKKGGSPRLYFGQGQAQAAAERKARSERQSLAWAIAKQKASEQGGSSREYLGESQREAAELMKRGIIADPFPSPQPVGPSPSDVIVPESELPDMPYNSVLKGTELLQSASRGGSGTFWVVNKGLGADDWDALSMKALQQWEDGDDYTVDDVMNMFDYLLDDGTKYVAEAKRVVYTEQFIKYVANGGDISDLGERDEED